VAVLGAAAGLERHDALDLDLGTAPLHPHVVRQLEQLRQMLVGQAQNLQDAFLIEAGSAVEHLGTGPIEDLWHGTDPNKPSVVSPSVGRGHSRSARTVGGG
jgi:hypothetical protein